MEARVSSHTLQTELEGIGFLQISHAGLELGHLQARQKKLTILSPVRFIIRLKAEEYEK